MVRKSMARKSMVRKSMSRKYTKRYRRKTNRTVRRKYKGGLTPTPKKKSSMFSTTTGHFGFSLPKKVGSIKKESGPYGFQSSPYGFPEEPAEQAQPKNSSEIRHHQEFLRRRAAAKADPNFAEKELAKNDYIVGRQLGQRYGKMWNDAVAKQIAANKENKSKKNSKKVN